MVEIEDREIIYNSYKMYAKSLQIEMRCLQQLLPDDTIQSVYENIKKRVRQGKIKGRIWTEDQI